MMELVKKPTIEDLGDFDFQDEEALRLFTKKLNLVELETAWKNLPQVEVPLHHEFMGGVYLRTIIIPKGTFVIGKRHRHESCNLLLAGDICIYMGEDQPVKTISAPCFFKSPPNSKKLGYALSDVIFINIHPYAGFEVEEAEKLFVIPEEEYQLQIEGGLKCLGSLSQ